MNSDDTPRWRVFLSHTSELRKYPAKGESYMDAVERAVQAAGHVAVDMREFPSIDDAPADVCIDRVAGCNVYVAVLGFKYGSPVRDRPEVSYTELEFDTATTNKIHRLVFVADGDAEDLGLPPSALIDRDYGDRQDAFRQRVNDGGLTAQRFKNPDDLRVLVAQSLRELADKLAEETHSRITAGITREQQPAEPLPVRETKFVNAPPLTAPSSFEDRHVETGLVAGFVADPASRLMTVVGRGGIGKTAMVCRLLKGLEAGRVADVEDDLVAMGVDGIVYLSQVGRHQVTYENLVHDLARLLPPAEADAIDALYRDPANTVEDVVYGLLESFPTGRVVVLLDNLESVLDPATDTLIDPAFRDALVALLRAPEHGVKVIVTTRVVPKGLAQVGPSSQQLLRLDAGLGSPDAENVLRALDPDGSLGLRDASDELLGRAREQAQGFPRALEAIKGILFDHSITLTELLDETAGVSADDVVEVLVGEAYQRLDPASQRVMQALAVYPAPVSAVAIDYLIQPYDSTVNSAPILARLVNRALARRDAGMFYLHPVDRAYALDQITAGQPGDAAPTYTLIALRARAADYFTQIRTPRDAWRTIDDLAAQLAEFDLRCDVDDYDTAATVLADIDFDYLRLWGHYRKLVELHTRIHGHLTDPNLERDHLANLGTCYMSLGDYSKAIDLHEQALAIASDLGDRDGESVSLTGLGNSYYRLGDYPKAMHLHEQALAIDRDLGDRQGEGVDLGNLGTCYFSLGDYPKAIALFEQALAIERGLGVREGDGLDLGNLGACYLSLGDYPKAIALFEQALAIDRDIGDRESEGLDLGSLGTCYFGLGDYPKAIELCEQALAIARELGDRYGEACALVVLGRSRLAGATSVDAIALFSDAVEIADTTNDAEPGAEAGALLARAILADGDPTAALSVIEQARRFDYPPVRPVLWLVEGAALVVLERPDEAREALTQAVATADELLARADRNVQALYTRGLALCGSALTAEPATMTAAADSFRSARAVTTASGLAAEATRLFDVLAAVDHAGVLSGLREAIEGTDV